MRNNKTHKVIVARCEFMPHIKSGAFCKSTFLIKTSILKNRCLDTVFDLKYSSYSFAKNHENFEEENLLKEKVPLL